MADTIRHVLFDADGVLQDLPGGWYSAMAPYLGDRARDFLHETWRDERPMLAGQGDYLPVLAATLEKYGVRTPVTEVYDAVWKDGPYPRFLDTVVDYAVDGSVAV